MKTLGSDWVALGKTVEIILMVGLAFASPGCSTERPAPPLSQAKFTGKVDLSEANKEFLIEQRKQFATLNDPYKLQQWAVKMIAATKSNERPLRIDSKDIPLRQPSRPKAIVGTVLVEEASIHPCVTILTGGSGAFGWHGLKLGDSTYQPSDPNGYYLEWIPGCYLYYFPPF